MVDKRGAANKHETYERLFQAIRKKATPQVWSSGVTLAREKKIVKESEESDSVTFVVLAGGLAACACIRARSRRRRCARRC